MGIENAQLITECYAVIRPSELKLHTNIYIFVFKCTVVKTLLFFLYKMIIMHHVVTPATINYFDLIYFYITPH